MSWQGPVLCGCGEDGALLLARRRRRTAGLLRHPSTLPSFEASARDFRAAGAGRKADGRFVCSYFGWGFDARSACADVSVTYRRIQLVRRR